MCSKLFSLQFLQQAAVSEQFSVQNASEQIEFRQQPLENTIIGVSKKPKDGSMRAVFVKVAPEEHGRYRYNMFLDGGKTT